MAFIKFSNFLLPPAVTSRPPPIIGHSSVYYTSSGTAIMDRSYPQIWSSGIFKKKNIKIFTLLVFHFPHFPSKIVPYIVNILHLGRVFLEINSFHLLCTPPPHFVLWVCLVQVALSNGRHLLFGVYWLNIRGQTGVQELASGSDSRLHGNYRINNQLRRFMTNPLKITFSVFIQRYEHHVPA